MLNSKLLKAKMVLHDLTPKEFGALQRWGSTTTYRKLNGSVAFTVPEVEVAIRVLDLAPPEVMSIFFTGEITESGQ